MIQELYPVTVSDEKIEQVLANCTGIESMDENEKEAFASFVSGTLAVDDSCKSARQLLTRGQALLIADKLTDYQMNYLADHTQRQNAEIRQISGEDGTITLPAMSYTTFNKKWSDSFAQQKAVRDAEAAARKAEAEKKAAEQKEAATVERTMQAEQKETATTEGAKQKEQKETATTESVKQTEQKETATTESVKQTEQKKSTQQEVATTVQQKATEVKQEKAQ